MTATPAPRGLAALPNVMRLIELALEEDLGRGDVTTASTVGAGSADSRSYELPVTMRPSTGGRT